MQSSTYYSFTKFILRTPLFSINFLNKLLFEKETSEETLKKICQQKEVQEAIFLASPVLYDIIKKWLADELNDKKEIKNLHQSLYKYFARMSGRCTPFGLFAGNSVGQINGLNNFVITDINKYQRVTRLDMNYMCALVQEFEKHSDIKDLLLYYPNNSIYKFGNKLRYVEYFYKNARRSHHLSSVDFSVYLEKVLDRAKNWASLFELAELLVDIDITIEEAKGFIEELIDNQLLLSEISPAVTGKDFLDKVLDFFETKGIKDNRYQLLKDVSRQLKFIDTCPPGIDIAKYQNIAGNLNNLGTDYELKYLFQTDMVKPAENLSVNSQLVDEVIEGIEVLNNLTVMSGETNLSRFKDAFYKKYEDAEIPLMQALDTESGIGYLQNNEKGSGDFSPLIEDIQINTTIDNSFRFDWNHINSYLFKKYIQAIKENTYEIEITCDEIENLLKNVGQKEKLPVTISSMVQVFKMGEGHRILLSSAGGSCAANLLGRFCHTDNGILVQVAEILEKEEEFYKNQIVAEIVHLPESRTGNILHRPILRKYEIPYLAKPSVSNDFQILPEDIMVSIRNNKILLKSKRFKKEIIPRLTTAHNYSNNALPVYQFLCDIQNQGLKSGVGFGWGPLANQYPFLPRVCYKNLIFSLAAWNIPKQEFEYLTKIKDDDALLLEVKKWRHKLKMPDWVALEEVDNKLPIKLSNLLSIKTLISTVKNRPFFKLVEFFSDEDLMLVQNNEGGFVNEMIFSFYRK